MRFDFEKYFWRLICEIFFLLIVFGQYATAQYSPWTSFNTAHGLGDVEVYTIYKSEFDSTLWFGTRNGLTHYNGRFENFDSDSDDSPGNSVRAIVEDNSGKIWIGTERGAKYLVNGKIPFQKLESLKDEAIWALAKDDSGNLWFGTSNGVWLLDQQFDGWNHLLPKHIIQAITKGDSGTMWFGTATGQIYYLKKNEAPKLSKEAGAPITKFFRDRKGRMLAATDGNKAFYYFENNWYPVDKGHNLWKNVTSIEQDWDGDFWYGTNESGLARYDSSSGWTYVTIDNSGIPSNHINDVKEDSYRHIWLATSNAGVCRFNSSWTVFKKGGNIIDVVWSMKRDKLGNMWFGFGGAGLYRYDYDNFHTIIDPIRNISIRAIEEDCSSNFWFGTEDKGVLLLKDDKWQPVDVRLSKGTFFSIFEDSNNNLWFGTLDSGVIRYEPNSSNFTKFTIKDSLANNTVRTINEDHNGILWFATNSGISYFDGKMHTLRSESNVILPEDVFTSIAEDDDGILWFGTLNNGLLKYTSPSKWELLKTGQQLASNTVHAVIFDQNNKRLWIGTERGANSLMHHNNRYKWQFFNPQTSGLPDRIVRSIQLESKRFYVSASDTVITSIAWFGTDNGIARYLGAALPPRTLILTSNDTTFSKSLPVFRVTAVDNISSPYEISFSYRTSASGNVWSEFYFGDFVIVRESLPSGRYQIEIRARDADGNIDPSPAKRDFSIINEPPDAELYLPLKGEHFAKKIEIIGKATTPENNNFFKYEIDYSKKDTMKWLNRGIQYLRSNRIESKESDTLAIWNVSILPDDYAHYTLRLTAEDKFGTKDSAKTDVIVDKLAADISVGADGGYATSSYGEKRISIFFPPKNFHNNITVAITTMDWSQSDSVVFGVTPTSICIGYQIIVKDGELSELTKPGILTIADPLLGIIRGVSPNWAIYYQAIGNKDVWERVLRFPQTPKNEFSAPFYGFGKYVVRDTLLNFSQLSVHEFRCQPRVFSTKDNNMSNNTTITFRWDGKEAVSIKIYNIAGRLIRNLTTNTVFFPGANSISWDGSDDRGDKCVSGIYIVCAQVNGAKKLETIAIANK